MLRVDVSLCGFTESWRFPGSRALGDWLSGLPWLEEGGICSIMSPAEVGEVSLIESLRIAAHAVHAGQDSLHIVEVESRPCHHSPLGACLDAFGLAWSDGKLRIAEELARILRTKPTLFIVRLVGDDNLEWWETLDDFAEIYSKRYQSSPLAIIVLSHAPLFGIRQRFDFRQGWPEYIDMWDEGLGHRDRWAAYRHCRIAWEAAGSIAIAEDLDERTWHLTAGDDDGLEGCFNDHALERIDKAMLTTPAWTQLLASYAHRYAERPAEEAAAIAALWWHPPHSLKPRLAPWVCRAVLLQQASAPSAWKLRNELFCEPLARSLFSVCQQGEALIRNWVLQSSARLPTSEESKGLMSRFQETSARNQSYPSNHPARPNDAWAFAPLGEVMSAASDRLPDSFWNLLSLRNTVAHGHFVGWQQVMAVLDFMKTVG